MGTEPELQFFVTNEHSCSYLPNQYATTIFADPKMPLDQQRYTQLCEQGFRRSGSFVYRPACQACSACIPLRLPVAAFKPNLQQQRVSRKNDCLNVTIADQTFSQADFELYKRYIAHQHHTSSMHPATQEQYRSFLLCQWSHTKLARFFAEDQLVCVAVIDHLQTGLSAVYTFYDPDFAHLSLGTYALLWQIEYCRAKQLRHLFLGYWIQTCRKMAYKSQYQPFEILINGQWRLQQPLR